MQGEGASTSLLGEPQNLPTLRDKMGRGKGGGSAEQRWHPLSPFPAA